MKLYDNAHYLRSIGCKRMVGFSRYMMNDLREVYTIKTAKKIASSPGSRIQLINDNNVRAKVSTHKLKVVNE